MLIFAIIEPWLLCYLVFAVYFVIVPIGYTLL